MSNGKQKYSFFFNSNIPYIAIIILLNVIFFFNFLVSPHFIISNPTTDIGSYFYSWRVFKCNAIKEGALPLWNPYTFAGTVGCASAQNDLFYPLSILYLIFPTGYAINLNIFVCFCLAGIFMFYLARSLEIIRVGALVSALIYNFSSYFILRTYCGHITIIQVLPLVPLFLLFLLKLFDASNASFSSQDLRHKCRITKKKKFVYVISASIVFSIIIFAGHTQLAYYTFLIAVFTFVYMIVYRYYRIHTPSASQTPLSRGDMEIREKIPGYYLIFYFILIFVLAGLLSAVQILPIYEFTKHSVRTGPLSYRFATEFSFPLRHIITFLFPDFYGDMVTVPYWSGYYFWEMCAYSGIVTLFLVAVGLFLKKNKMAILFAGLGIFGLIFSFGGNTPLFKLLYNFLPGMRFLRGHSKFMFVVVMSMSILAGFGINNLLEELNERAKKRLIIILLLIFILLLIMIIYFVRLGSINDENWQELIIKTLQKEQNFFNKNHLKSESFFENAREQSLHSIYRTLVIVDISFVLFVILIVSKKLKGVSVVLLVLVLFGDLYSYNKKFLIGADESSFQLPKPIVDELKDNKQYFRIANSVFRLVNRPMQFSVYDACGYDSNILLRYAEYLNFIQDLPSGFQQFVAQIKRISPLLIQSFGIKYFILSPDVKLDSDAFQTIVKERDYQFVKLNIDVPRAVIFHNIVVAKDKEEARKFLLENKDKYFEKLVLEADLIDDIKNIKIPTKNDSSNNINEEQVEITDYSINSVSMKAKVNKEGYLFLSDVYYPGWKVKVDGKQERIYRANYLFRAVYLDKGEHNIEFYFQPSSFIIGAIISLLTIMSYISYFLYYHLKKI